MIILRNVAIFLLVALSIAAMGFTSRTESKIEGVSLHDKRLIKVERKVHWTTKFHILDPFFGLPILPRFETSGPDKFSLEFKHPDTQETITWQGEPHYRPILLDIVDGVPYLVANGPISKETEAVYGCPELPYFYLKYEPGFFGKWVVVPVEKAPNVLRISNLSQDRRNDGGYFQPVIPRTYDEWNYMYKNNHRNERNIWDCRPPLQALPDVPMPKPVDVDIEVVESNDYSFPGANEYYKFLSDKKGTAVRANCKRFFLPPQPENLMQGERFVKDMSGNIRLPYSGSTPYPSGRMLENRAERYCDDKFVWFVAGHEEVGKTIISKYTNSGDLLYNVRIQSPQITNNKRPGSMVIDSGSAKDEHFSFYWDEEFPISSGSSIYYKHRVTKYRFREPMR